MTQYRNTANPYAPLHTNPFINDDVCFYSQPPVISLRQRLVRLKDEIAVEEKCGVIYNIKCKDCDAGRANIGETTRKLGTRLNEHQ